MNERIGLMYIPDDSESNMSADKPYSKHLQNLVDIEARKLVYRAYSETEKILVDNKDKLIKVSFK